MVHLPKVDDPNTFPIDICNGLNSSRSGQSYPRIERWGFSDGMKVLRGVR